MEPLHYGVDRATIALWLGHESIETTCIHPHADLELKRRAMARTTPARTPLQSHKPQDTVLSFLNSLRLFRIQAHNGPGNAQAVKRFRNDPTSGIGGENRRSAWQK